MEHKSICEVIDKDADYRSPIFSAKKILGKVLIWKTQLGLFLRPSQIIRREFYSVKFQHTQERLYTVRNVVSLASVVWSRHATQRALFPREETEKRL